jgi:hypothetical protein
VRQGAEVETKIIRPQHYREEGFPKAQTQKPDSEEPSADPHGPHEGMLRYPYLLRVTCAGLSDRAILEINLAAAYMNFVNRVAEGLGVELETSMQAFTR